MTLAGTPGDCSRLGSKILAAADLDLDDQETVLGTFRETIDQALSGLANATTSFLGREITAGPSQPVSDTAQLESSPDLWTTLLIEFRSGDVYRFYLSANEAFLNGFSSPSGASASDAPAMAVEPLAQSATGMQHPSLGRGGLVSQTPEGKNSDLLFDVELPVCVSFGRAYLQLKDVLKLTTGSIVELNRTVSEPVEVIVNNCVIARGEVVVVEGNFGVRIQEVISRQERLRTLH
jgi:flagellar motor switch protein FliN/FliY